MNFGISINYARGPQRSGFNISLGFGACLDGLFRAPCQPAPVMRCRRPDQYLRCGGPPIIVYAAPYMHHGRRRLGRDGARDMQEDLRAPESKPASRMGKITEKVEALVKAKEAKEAEKAKNNNELITTLNAIKDTNFSTEGDKTTKNIFEEIIKALNDETAPKPESLRKVLEAMTSKKLPTAALENALEKAGHSVPAKQTTPPPSSAPKPTVPAPTPLTETQKTELINELIDINTKIKIDIFSASSQPKSEQDKALLQKSQPFERVIEAIRIGEKPNDNDIEAVLKAMESRNQNTINKLKTYLEHARPTIAATVPVSVSERPPPVVVAAPPPPPPPPPPTTTTTVAPTISTERESLAKKLGEIADEIRSKYTTINGNLDTEVANNLNKPFQRVIDAIKKEEQPTTEDIKTILEAMQDQGLNDSVEEIKHELIKLGVQLEEEAPAGT